MDRFEDWCDTIHEDVGRCFEHFGILSDKVCAITVRHIVEKPAKANPLLILFFKKKTPVASVQIFMPFYIGKFVFRNSLWLDVKALGFSLWELSFFSFHFLLHVLTHTI